MHRRLSRIGWSLSGAGVAFLLALPQAWAFSLDPSSFSNPMELLDPGVVTSLVKGLGFATDHRAYEGAAGLGVHAGFDISPQATLVKLPTEFRNALQQAGLGSPPIPVLPMPRLNLHKGLGERVDAGFSWIIFKEIQVIGFDFKVVVSQPEEGPTWAVRLNYTSSKIRYGTDSAYLQVTNKTWKPEVLVSQQLDFAEPYLGVGYQYTTGTLSFDVPLGAPLPDVTGSKSAKGGGGLAFIGLGLKAPSMALKLTLDGEYSTAGAHALGAKFGFSF